MHQDNGFRLGKQLLQTGHSIRLHLDSLFEEDDLTGLQGRLVGFVFVNARKGREIYQKDIEEEFRIGRSSVTSVLNNLEKNGFILRQPVENDRRLKKIVLTEKALRTAQRHGETLDRFEAQLAALLSPEELALMSSALERIALRLDPAKEEKQ